MIKNQRIRNLVFILLGVLVLVFKRYYAGPFNELVNNHGSNFSVSFAVYFVALMGFDPLPRTRLIAVAGSLLAVELFELTNGFGVMENVYDPWDYLANALGIGLALGIDLVLSQVKDRKDQADG
ncbi:MAG: hypothetical protein E4H33_02560 [Anaerolineales bacterium]|nr:MAG: hypothetical protein E4H33_02560 [Anaerolineales bacterium]